jgi:CubicO group peptidase (beta-lactamase class C family)
MFKPTLLATLLLGNLLSNAQSDGFIVKKLDSFYTLLSLNNKMMGSVEVMKDGKTLFRRAYGKSDIGKKIIADTFTKYRIGSASNIFTATLVMKAIEEKRLALNQTIERFFPTIKGSNQITIKQLLGHRSGIYNFSDDTSFESWRTKPIQEMEMIQKISSGKPRFSPDSSFEFSNSNYLLLTHILEKVYRKPIDTILKYQITKPLGLKNTYAIKNISPIKFEAHSYSFLDQWIQEVQTHHTVARGAGTIMTNPHELLIFMKELMNHRILNDSGWYAMLPPKGQLYGYGLTSLPMGPIPGFGHSAFIDGFVTMIAYYPSSNIGYALCSNGMNYDVNAIASNSVGLTFGDDFPLPDFKRYQVKPEDMAKYVGNYFEPQIRLELKVEALNDAIRVIVKGQPPMMMEAKDLHKFRFDAIQLEGEFDLEKNELIMIQSGKALHLKKLNLK